MKIDLIRTLLPKGCPMKKIITGIVICVVLSHGADNVTTETPSIDTVSYEQTAEAEDTEVTIHPEGKPFLISGYSCVAAGIVSLGCGASFLAGYNNRPAMGEPDDPDTGTVEKDPKLRKYARICAWTGLILELGSIPFLVVGYRQKKRHKAYLDRKLYGSIHGDGTVELGVALTF